ncbi:RHS repeat domain-containing protein [Gilliamella intestini]|uniref:RHS repeat-associated core domain-containing protein n=1 Tax=Gilliamella intestini TaxID=1798183 RepID=A0A1C4APS7_9GAMM|nr:RHS repeat-associated core domain-containing protein [Gilliamella intestini]SCB96557.1 RHS repeat-associated core domain-containing protein [Gilliamella intestini]
MLDRPEPVENLTTWVYEEGSLVPTAKLCEGKSYSIVSDYLGRPAQAYDDKGELVWQVEFDIYGRIREDTFNNQPFIPFRQLGQYEDVETGLYYNRFRYYDSNTGTYISQDPIGLAGNNPNFYAYTFDSNSEVDPFGLMAQAGSGKPFQVGIHEDLIKINQGMGLDSHHVGQKAIMKKFIPGYDPMKAPAILVPSIGHTEKGVVGIVSRNIKGINSARDLLARDIRELKRVYPDIPNSKLKELIELNKKMYPEAFKKPEIKCK